MNEIFWSGIKKMIQHYQFTGSPALWPLWDSLQQVEETCGEGDISPEKVIDIVERFDKTGFTGKDQVIFENFSAIKVLARLLDNNECMISEIIEIHRSRSMSPDLLFPYFFYGQHLFFAEFWSTSFMLLSKEVKRIHHQERKNNILNGAIYKFKYTGNLIIVGDIHGDICSLLQLLKTENFFNDEQKHIIFIGDYIDNGPHQLATLFLPLLMKVWYPGRVYLLKGNHEHLHKTSRNKIVPLIYGSNMFFDKFRGFLSHKCLLSIYNTLMDFPAVIELNEQVGIVHGGIPRPVNDQNDFFPHINSLNDLNKPELLFQMLWNRPANKTVSVQVSEVTDFETTQPHFESFIKKMGWKYMIRGHCPETAGFNTFYDERMITLYSTGNAMSYYSYIRPVYAVLNTLNNELSNRTILTIKKVYGGNGMEQILFTKELNQ